MVRQAEWSCQLSHVDGRVLVVTNLRDLDKQLAKVFKGVDEDIYHTKSGADLVKAPHDPTKSLICSLLHKFGTSEEGNIDQYLSDRQSRIPDAPATRTQTPCEEVAKERSHSLERMVDVPPVALPLSVA